MPYMAAHLPRRYLLQSLLERNDWACEIVGVQTTEMEGFSFTRLQNTTAAFWKDPRHDNRFRPMETLQPQSDDWMKASTKVKV